MYEPDGRMQFDAANTPDPDRSLETIGGIRASGINAVVGDDPVRMAIPCLDDEPVLVVDTKRSVSEAGGEVRNEENGPVHAGLVHLLDDPLGGPLPVQISGRREVPAGQSDEG